jgi:SAM-dependent methyltransferase
MLPRAAAPFARTRVPDIPLTSRDISLVYRLVLRRAPDAGGMASYLEQAAHGLSLEGLIKALKQSDEYRALAATPRESDDGTLQIPGPPADAELISPKDVMERLSLDALNQTAEEYYSRVDDPAWLMAKPFASLTEAPQMLQNLGALFEGLHLGQMMTVLDFGGGTGWLSRQLAQLNCKPICCDVSATALSIGRRLFEAQPPLGLTLYTPQFLHFDGRHLDLPDQSVDRIVCFDAFHHVPNPADVLAEFGRVLRDGGIAGFSEPGRYHSRAPQSQYEMRHHQVLENDIDLNEIFTMARAAGFTDLTMRGLSDLEMTLADYNEMFGGDDRVSLSERVWERTHAVMATRSIFFLHKGARRLDSRSAEGLNATIRVSRTDVDVAAGETFSLAFTLVNVGRSAWLDRADEIFGLVRLGSHLSDGDGKIITIDLARYELPRRIEPGETADIAVDIALPTPGRFLMSFDLVSEGVSWFENLGVKPVTVRINVGAA